MMNERRAVRKALIATPERRSVSTGVVLFLVAILYTMKAVVTPKINENNVITYSLEFITIAIEAPKAAPDEFLLCMDPPWDF